MALYKFKSSTELNIEDLENDRLYVATLTKMNDPMDLGFFIRDRKLPDTEIKRFQIELNKAFVVISLSQEFLNRRLWNYYTDGMKGMFLAYRKEDLIAALKRLGSDEPIAGEVKYDVVKKDLSKTMQEYLKTNKLPKLEEESVLFHKDQSWGDEKEYRIIVNSSFLGKHPGAQETQGIKLTKITPYKIGIGYKIGDAELDRITAYAKSKGIPLWKYTPDFRKKSSKAFISERIDKDDEVEELEDDTFDMDEERQREFDKLFDELIRGDRT